MYAFALPIAQAVRACVMTAGVTPSVAVLARSLKGAVAMLPPPVASTFAAILTFVMCFYKLAVAVALRVRSRCCEALVRFTGRVDGSHLHC